MELKRKQQRTDGFIWFATYDTFIFEDELRKVLSKPEFAKDSSFP